MIEKSPDKGRTTLYLCRGVLAQRFARLGKMPLTDLG